MHIKDVLLMTLATIAFGGMATAIVFGIYNTPDAANTMPATLAPQPLDKLDADRLHMAVATALGVRS